MKNQLYFAFLIIVICVSVTETVAKEKLFKYSIGENRALKKSLGFNEDTYLNFTELSTKYGYKSEKHTVTTQDGYILTVFRILSKCKTVNPNPVLLLHGIIDNSDLWIVAGPRTGLGYILSDNCYDVWAGNHRGNHYSRKHIKWNPDTDPQFWNFSFDEHGNYDVPAFIDYILETTNREKIFYIGHSQGTTDFFAMASLKPQYNNKVALSVHLAPVTWLANLASPLPKLAIPFFDFIKTFLESAGYYEIVARDQILHFLLEYLCQTHPELLCGNILAITTGYEGKINSKLISVAFGHVIDGISTKSLAHFGQLIKDQEFKRYDEGRKGNFKRYGSPTPPAYNVTSITSPVVLIVAQHDWISTVGDAEILASRLPNVVENYVVPDRTWSHHNVIWGTQAEEYVFPKILNYFNMFSN